MFENVPDLSVAEVRHLIDEGMRQKCIDAGIRPPWPSGAAKIPGDRMLPHPHRRGTRYPNARALGR
jgi:hypothetical protein